MPQPGQHTALQDFFQWESQSWVEVVEDLPTDEKAHFMPVQNLKSYFTANDSKKLTKILAEVFKSDFPPIDPDLILRDHTAIFCILLRIGRGECIEHFARYEELSDRRLPFDPTHPPAEFLEADDDPAFAQRFCEKQRMYCVPVFDGHMLHKHFGRQRLLPITSKEPYGQQGAAEKFVIKVYGPHNKLLPPGKDPQINNTFVLKRYSTKENKEDYTQEVNGFRSVKHADSIIRFYGSYIHGDESNVLLEYADKGSLEEYFRNETPPSRGLDIIKFWENMFQLIKGLKAIHSVRDGHHGVNPDSVLVLSNGAESSSDWQFKFADFGETTTKSKSSSPEEGTLPPTETEISSTYAPPESYMPYHSDGSNGRSPGKMTWTADIWSLGCIYSEAAIWIADGFKGLLDYRKQRMAESDRILFKAVDCFHDGEKVLSSVVEAHNEIEDRLRRSDYVTKDVLDSLVDEMLWEDDRPNAKALTRKAEMVLSRARNRFSANSGDEISRSLSSQSRSVLPPRLPPPTQALPPIPRGAPPTLSSITEQQAPNVEKWRAQITSSRRSQFSATASDAISPTLSNRQLSNNRRSPPPDVDKDPATSTASWQMTDDRSRAGDNSSTDSPNTPFTSPHVSMHFNFSKHNSMIDTSEQQQPRVQNQVQPDERPRVARSQTSYEFKIPPRSQSRGVSYVSNNGSSTSESAVSPPPKYPGPGSYTAYSPPPALDNNQSTAPAPAPAPAPAGGGYPLVNQSAPAPQSSTGYPVANQSFPPPPANNGRPPGGPPQFTNAPIPPTSSSPPSVAQTAPPRPNNTGYPFANPSAAPAPASNGTPFENQDAPPPFTHISPQFPSQNGVSSPISNAPYLPTQMMDSPVLHFVPMSSNPIHGPPVFTPQAPNENQGMARPLSVASSQISTANSLPYPPVQNIYPDPPVYPRFPGEEQIRPKSSKRGLGFSLFPTKSKRDVAPPVPNTGRPLEKSFTQSTDTERRSIRSSISGHTIGTTPAFSDAGGNFEYLSLNTCLEWKKAHKKIKKAAKVPPLPGAYMLDSLNDRDHVFIIDDSASMASVWPEVKRVFEALSYTVKGMSPDGTELFYTVAYDTYRRKDTSDLCDDLEKKTTAGVTNICYRLNLQLQSYHAKIANAKGARGKKAIVRPMSFYILTNGEWGKVAELKKLIKETVDFLKKEGMGKGQVTIEFISFTQNSNSVLNELEKEDFGLDIVDCTRWTGNVLKMLRGPLDKSLYSSDTGASSNVNVLPSPPVMGSPGLMGDTVINELA